MTDLEKVVDVLTQKEPRMKWSRGEPRTATDPRTELCAEAGGFLFYIDRSGFVRVLTGRGETVLEGSTPAATILYAVVFSKLHRASNKAINEAIAALEAL